MSPIPIRNYDSQVLRKPLSFKCVQLKGEYGFFLPPQVITTMCVPSAWMNMKREINSESCRALMVSDYKIPTVTLTEASCSDLFRLDRYHFIK